LFISSRVHEGEVLRASAECDRAFTRAAQSSWKNVSLQAVETLRRCAAQTPPASCEDREALLDLVARAARLFPNGGFYGAPYEILLNLEDGRSFGLGTTKTGTGCDAAIAFLARADWLSEDDEKAARQLIDDAARCHFEFPYKSIDPALRTFLTHTDAWPFPDEASANGRQRYPLASFMGTPRPVDPMSVIRPQKPWEACKTSTP
jgi:hypothetical protein